jgi:L-alanine-DL-glutamate epimerase-like enolase superfamily enzyme
MKLHVIIQPLHPRHPFGISRAVKTGVRNVFLRIEHDGVTGWGEASPNPFYKETAEAVAAKLDAAGNFIGALAIRSVADIEAAWENSWPLLAPSRAAQCALDVALWDWFAQREGVSVAELLWGKKPRPVTTFCTIGLSSREELESKLAELGGFPRIKIKADRTGSLDAVRLARTRTDAMLAVDANCAWSADDIRPLAGELAGLGVEFIEQPLPPEQDAAMPGAHPLPFIADESCVTADDVPRAAAHFDGFNIKLVKCGGITPARRMALRGRDLGMRLMTGCMLESSLLIAAGAAIAQRTGYADLDGAWLLADDPFTGWAFSKGVLLPPGGAGLGSVPA